MAKIFNLKEWLTLSETARYLTISFGEEVQESDVLRLCLDGKLQLSINFVNTAKARCGKLKSPEEARYKEFPADVRAALKAKTVDEYQGGHVLLPIGIVLNSGDVIDLEDEIYSLSGIYSIPLIGGDRLDVEQKFQMLIGGPHVTMQSLDGAFVEAADGVFCQLQDSFDDNEFIEGSSAQLERLFRQSNRDQMNKESADSKRAWREKREQFLKKYPDRENANAFYPSGGLPKDALWVVLTEDIRQFERSIGNGATESEKPLSNRERDTLLTIIAALCKDAHFDHTKSAKTAGLIYSTAVSMGLSIGESTIEGHLKRIPNALAGKMR